MHVRTYRFKSDGLTHHPALAGSGERQALRARPWFGIGLDRREATRAARSLPLADTKGASDEDPSSFGSPISPIAAISK